MSATAHRPRQLDPLLEAVDEHVRRCRAELQAGLPTATPIIDVHTHVGADEDGMLATPTELVSTLDTSGIAHAFTFCLNEPDSDPRFSAPNDRTFAHAAGSEGRLLPFARLDLEQQPAEELRRALALGARGVKLHPRAQHFALSDDRLHEVFALAAQHAVPILIHGGSGLGPVTEELRSLSDRHPGTRLIIAHAGIGDMANLVRAFAGSTGVFFDTSTWSPLDIAALLTKVSARQVLYGSDYPYGQQPASLYCTWRASLQVGLSTADLQAVLGGNALEIEEAAPLSPPGAAPCSSQQPSLSLSAVRLHQYIGMAAPMLWARRSDSFDSLGLAIAACEEPEHMRVREMLVTARGLWGLMRDLEPRQARSTARGILQLLQLADALAVS